MNHAEVYCRCCGQRCQPVKTMRPPEDYDGPASCSRLVEEFVSNCCGDALSRVPVTDQCAQCGEVAARGSSFPTAPDGTALCPGCMALFRDHGDMEGLVFRG